MSTRFLSTSPRIKHSLQLSTIGLLLGLLACAPQGVSKPTDEFSPAEANSGTDNDAIDNQDGLNSYDQEHCHYDENGNYYCDEPQDNPGDNDGTDPGNGDCGEAGCDANGNPIGDGNITDPNDNPDNGNPGSGDCGEAGCDANGNPIGDDENPLGDDTDMQPNCFEENFSPSTNAAADLLLVVDRSGSMAEVPAGAANTKWDQVRSVISNVAMDLDENSGLGMMFFPAGASQDLQCIGGSVVVDIADNNGQAISNAFAATGPGGGTPTAATLQIARAHLHNRLSQRPQAVVLATDGAPNCNAANDINTCVCSQDSNCTHPYACLDDDATVHAVNDLANEGIATFVIGIPGSELFSNVLDAMAVAGGTASNGAQRYYDTSSETELEQALRGIGTRLAHCRFELQNEAMGSSVSVRINGQNVSRDPGRVDGWDYVGARTIEFFGPACQALANDGSAIAVNYCSQPQG